MQSAAEFIRAQTDLRPAVGVVLGSGLGGFADHVNNAIRFPYRAIPGMPVSTAIGHAGQLVLGTIEGVEVAVLSGRFHLYEGYSAQQVASGVRLLHELGVKTLLLTCAAGGLNLEYAEGALVLLADHINLQGANPLVGPNDDRLGPRFPDMTQAYSPALREIAKQTAAELAIELPQGVYAAVLGPSYETPAEIRFLKRIGADLVGMSTVAETIAANHLGMRVAGIACVTNLAAGLGSGKLVHDDVLAIAKRVSGTFLKLVGALIPKLAKA